MKTAFVSALTAFYIVAMLAIFFGCRPPSTPGVAMSGAQSVPNAIDKSKKP